MFRRHNLYTSLARRYKPLMIEAGNEAGFGGCITQSCDANGFGLTGGTSTIKTLINKLALYAESSAQTAGGTRGTNAVDLQFVRNASTQIAAGTGSALVGGSNNRASGTTSGAFAGSGNTVSTQSAVILGGEGHTINTSCTYSAILGGQAHSFSTGTTHAAALGGANFVIAHDYCVAIGSNTEPFSPNQFAHGVFPNGANTSWALQSSQYSLALKQTMVTATWYNLQDNDFNNGCAIPTDSVWTFKILLTGATAGMTNVSSYEIVGAIENDGGTVTLLASTVTVIYEDTAGHDAQVIADDTNNRLLIQVQQNTGSDQANVYHATVTTSEINKYA